MAASIGDIRDLIDYRLREIKDQMDQLEREQRQLKKALKPLADHRTIHPRETPISKREVVDLLNEVVADPSIANYKLAERLNIPSSRVARLIRKARTEGLANRPGKYWSLTEPKASRYCVKALKPEIRQIINTGKAATAEQVAARLTLSSLPTYIEVAIEELAEAGDIVVEAADSTAVATGKVI